MLEKIYCPKCGTELGYKTHGYMTTKKGFVGRSVSVYIHDTVTKKSCPNGCDKLTNENRIKSLADLGITELKTKC
jgi:hypothetical protein